MKQTVNNSQFHDAFFKMDRSNQFSYEALNLIYEYLESIEADTGEEIELDVIAICCEYSEMTLDDVHNQYASLFEDLEDNEKPTLEYALDRLNDETIVVGTTSEGTIVFAQF